jgi:LPXTG-site transpeptidase (sortase) family protein
MRAKISLLWAVIILGAVGIVCAGAIIFFADPYAPGQSTIVLQNIVDATTSAETVAGIPVFLFIPKIDVDAAIAPVGLTSDGEMGVPTGPTGTTWFDLGPRPGEVGSAVIAGHEGWKDGIAAAFDNLYKLRVGDQLYVQDEHGVTTAFVVRRVATYDQNGDASDVFNSSDGGAHLNLITCEGTWNAAEKSYSDRLVVFADLVK